MTGPRIREAGKWLSDRAVSTVDAAAARSLESRAAGYGDTTFEATNRSGATVKPAYGARDLEDVPPEDLGMPGQFLFGRGIYPIRYQYQPWMVLQIIGYGVASQLRERMDLLREQGGSRGYFGGEAHNLIFDMLTSMGFDPDLPAVQGAVGDCGVSICKARDLETLFAGMDLAKTHVSMVANAGSPGLLALYPVAARRMGFAGNHLGGNITNYIWGFFGRVGRPPRSGGSACRSGASGPPASPLPGSAKPDPTTQQADRRDQ